jgi:transposase
MPFAGLDLHKKEVEAAILPDHGNQPIRYRFPATNEGILAFAQSHLSKQHQIAVEATTNTWALVRLLQPLVHSVHVSNPVATHAIAKSKVKTDKVDALVLAQLLRSGFLPTVWTPDETTSELRRRCTERANLTHDRVRIKNRIHAILHQHLIPLPQGDLFSDSNLRWLAQLNLPAFEHSCLARQLFFLDMVDTEITLFNDDLARHAYHSPEVKLLMTIPGVDFPVAETILSTLGDWTRFPDGDHAASYFGLVPSTYQSGDKCYHGPITKKGKGHARWMLVQAAQHLDKHPGPLGASFRRLQKKKNRNMAVVATARKIVTIAWQMLKNNEPYRYADPKTTAAKMSRLRVRATGERRKGGNPKGEPRPASHGSGQPTRAVPALETVYAKEALPPLRPLAPGESKMLEQSGTAGYAAQIRRSYRVPKRTAPPSA